jgi:hypothetical protein
MKHELFIFLFITSFFLIQANVSDGAEINRALNIVPTISDNYYGTVTNPELITDGNFSTSSGYVSCVFSADGYGLVTVDLGNVFNLTKLSYKAGHFPSSTGISKLSFQISIDGINFDLINETSNSVASEMIVNYSDTIIRIGRYIRFSQSTPTSYACSRFFEMQAYSDGGYIRGTVNLTGGSTYDFSGSNVGVNYTSTLTNLSGRYFLNLLAGSYIVNISKLPEYYSTSSSLITVTSSSLSYFNATLTKKPTGTISGRVCDTFCKAENIIVWISIRVRWFF